MRTFRVRVERLERRCQPAPDAASRPWQPSPEQQREVLDILLEIGALRVTEDGVPLCLTNGEWTPWSHSAV